MPHQFDHSSQGQVSHEVEVEGHLIDSMILQRIWAKIMDMGGDFEVLEFNVGKKKTDTSHMRMLVKGNTPSQLNSILQEIYRLGAVSRTPEEAKLEVAMQNKVAPEDFYSTTNNPTYIHLNNRWIAVENIMMDKAIVVFKENMTACCIPLVEIRKGDFVVTGEAGIRVKPLERPRENVGVFEFMSSTASSEKPAAPIIKQIAADILNTRSRNNRIVVVAGPAVVHTGARKDFADMVAQGYVDALLAGNALAVHDVEAALYGTSLGVSLTEGTTSERGHRNHMAAINEIFKAGSLRGAVEKGVLTNGIMYECIRHNVPYVLAGSIRDDGPLPDTICDIREAQAEYRKQLKNAELVIMLSTMLHSIAVGNMLPSNARIVCVDINPATVTKLLDRGSFQAVGVISDVGTFLPMLMKELQKSPT